MLQVLNWIAAIVLALGGTFLLCILPDTAYGDEDVRLAPKDSAIARENKARAKNRAAVLVLGDIGRSPRMQNHVLSMAKAGLEVDFIGYVESEVHPAILKLKYVTIYPIPKAPKFLQTDNRKLFMVYGPLKVLYQSWSLFRILAHKTSPAKNLLVQNPPSIPTLFIASLTCFLRKTNLVIDWHNYGYSILALKLGVDHPMVKVSRWYERRFARSASVNFTVTEAMKRQVKRDFGVTAPIVKLYDRPTSYFKPIDSTQRLEFLRDMALPTAQTEMLEKGKMKVLVSSTSWTPDEDFSLLLDALVGYSKLATTSHPQLPELLVVITGKGPQKEFYLKKIGELEAKGDLEMITLKTAWLPTEAYALLLASADIGISLHKSSSGVDLPMKVVDMFGAGLPVVGWGMFEAWPELVKDGVNGRSFGSVEDLQAILVRLLGDDGSKLKTLKDGALEESKYGWDDEWSSTAGKVFRLDE